MGPKFGKEDGISWWSNWRYNYDVCVWKAQPQIFEMRVDWFHLLPIALF